MKLAFHRTLIVILIILSPIAANALEYSIIDGVFLSRPGTLPSTNQSNNTPAEDLAYPRMGADMLREGQVAGENARDGAAETKSGTVCASPRGDHVWAKSPLARMIVLSFLFIFLGIISEIAVAPPFRKNVAEDLIASYRNTWRLIMLFAILGGALLLPAVADILTTSAMGLNHRESSKDPM